MLKILDISTREIREIYTLHRVEARKLSLRVGELLDAGGGRSVVEGLYVGTLPPRPDLTRGARDQAAQSSVAPDGSPSVAPEAGAPSSAPRVNAGIGQTPEGDGGDGKDGQ